MTSLARELGGAERSLDLLLAPLQDLGWRVTVIAPPGPVPRAAANSGATVVEHEWDAVPAISVATRSRARYRPVELSRAAWASTRNAAWLYRFIARNPTDVLLSNSFHAHPFTLLAGRLHRRRVVIYLRDLVRPGPGAHVLEWVCAHADATIANSSAVAASVIRARPHVIENPVVSQSHASHLRRGGGPVVYLGRFDRGKGLETLARAAPDIPASIELHGRPVVSPASFASTLVERARKAGARIDARGWTDTPEDVLRGAAVLILPSESEPWGRSAAEAMAAGVPVVAARGGGIIDLVEDGVSGLLFPPGDAPALAAQVRRVLEDTDLAGRLADGGRLRISGLEPSRQAAAVAGVLDRVLQQ